MTQCQICHGTDGYEVQTAIKDWEFGVPGTWNYWQCNDCQTIQLQPFPDLTTLKSAYPDNYSAHVENASSRGWLYQVLYRVNDYAFRRYFGAAISPQSVVMDVGCGNGEFLQRLHLLGAQRLVGVDFNQNACDIAASKGIESFAGLFVDYPDEAASFDAIFMINYIEHVLNPDAELLKVYQLLKPGAYLIGETPNFNAWDNRWFKRFWGGNHVPRHTYQYTPEILTQKLHAAGFEDVAIKFDFNPALIVISMQNWLQRKQPDLRNNPNLQHGRMRYFSLWLLLALPVNVVLKLFSRAGIMKFKARKKVS